MHKISLTKTYNKNSGECRARSDCTYVQADLDLHAPQNKPMFTKYRIRVTICLHLNTRLKLSISEYGLDCNGCEMSFGSLFVSLGNSNSGSRTLPLFFFPYIEITKAAKVKQIVG